MTVQYLPRVADGLLERGLRTSGAVLIEGPKACGKSATAEQFAAETVRLDVDGNARDLVRLAPDLLLDRPAPLLLDEWQVAPELWGQVRRAVDDRALKGQFILTGSATPNDDVKRHSGAGRFSRIQMHPMSLFESRHSSGHVSLSAMCDGERVLAADPGLTIPDLFERIVTGGWPALVGASSDDAVDWVSSYISNSIEIDVPHLGTRRDPTNVRRLLESLGRSVGTSTTVTELAKDVLGESTQNRGSIYDYLSALRRLMLLSEVPAWNTHMRSKTRLRATPKWYFVDPSLGTGALRQTTTNLLKDLNAAGLHFEALVMRDLRIYAQPLDGDICTWRSAEGHEVDFILTLRDGRWGAVEVKLSPDEAEKAAGSLVRFREMVDTTRMGDPAFLAVITGTGASYTRRTDGVHVVSIATLGP